MSVSNVTYNINVTSKFSLFYDDEICEAEPDEIVKKLQVEKKKKDIALKEAKKQKAQKVVPKPEEPVVEDKKVNEKAPRFQRNDNRNLAKVPVEKQISNLEQTDKNKKNKKSLTTSVPPRKFRGREYDRHSGSDKTGVKPVDKRDGSGAHNWGSIKDAVEVAQEEVTKEEDKQSENETVQEPEKKEPEVVTMTMSEWKALNKENTVMASNRQRAANNGEDVFSGMNAYQKRYKNYSESDNEIMTPDEDLDSRGKREIKLNVEFTGRNRRGRGGYNANRFTRDYQKKVDKDVLLNLDENEFPVLS